MRNHPTSAQAKLYMGMYKKYVSSYLIVQAVLWQSLTAFVSGRVGIYERRRARCRTRRIARQNPIACSVYVSGRRWNITFSHESPRGTMSQTTIRDPRRTCTEFLRREKCCPIVYTSDWTKSFQSRTYKTISLS